MIGLTFVDGTTLPEPIRAVLRPDEPVRDAAGTTHRLPRWFYEVPSWSAAQGTMLAAHFAVWEFVNVDVYEAEPQRLFPRYVPCAVALLAGQLELVRLALGHPLHLAVNGGYRSPGHAWGEPTSAHRWATAADLNAVGDVPLGEADGLAKLAATVARVAPALRVRPPRPGDDHLHLDLGPLLFDPRPLHP